MKKQLILLLTLFSLSFAFGQSIFIDDFNRADSNTVGNSWNEYETTNSGGQIYTNRLRLGSGTSGRDYISQDLSSLTSPIVTNGIVNNTSILEWAFNFKGSRTNPSGFDNGNYGQGFILGDTKNNAIGSGKGYAVIIGQSGGTDPIRLAKFTGGVNANSNFTNIISGGDYGTQYISVKVTYDPSNDEWKLYAESNSSAYPQSDPRNTSTLIGTAMDNTYTGTGNDLKYCGALYNHSGNNNYPQYYDDVYMPNVPVANATDSDAVAPVNPNPQIAAATIQSTATTNNDAVDVFRMLLQDSGSGDSLPTNITNIRIKPHTTNTADWSDFIQGVVVYDDSNYITPSNVDITDAYIDISFNSGDLVVPDNESNNLTVGVYLNTSNILDGKILSFMVDATNHGFTADSSGSDFAATFSGGNFNSNDFTVDVEATELRITQQPTTVVVQTIMSPAVTAYYSDENGNRDIDYDGLGATATLSATGSTLSSSTTVAGTPTQGIMTFNDIKFDTSNTGVTLTITDSGNITNTTITSTTFNVLNYTPCSTTNTQIIFEDFEDSTLTYTTTKDESSDGSYDYFVRYDGSNIGSGVSYSNMQGSGYFGAQDTNAAPTSFSVAYLQFNNIDISDMDNFKFSVFLAEDDASDGNEDWDANTYLHVAYRVDGGSWVNLLWVEAFNGANSRPAIDNNFNGVGDSGVENEITDAFKLFERNFNTQGSSLDISFKFGYLDDGNEDIAIDNIKLTGDLTNSTTWNGTAWSNGTPTATTKAIIDADYNTSTANIEACACQVNSGNTLTVGAGDYLLIETDVENNGTIEVENNASIVQHKNDAVLSGNGLYKINRTTPSYAFYDYTYWSSPVTNETIGSVFNGNPTGRIYDFVTANFSDKFSGSYPQTTGNADSFDDDNDDWHVTDVAEVLSAGKGYIAMGAGSPFPLSNPLATGSTTQSVVFDGGTLNNGIITVNVSLDKYNTDNGSGNANNTNLNLIGNPYASAIDITKLRTDSNNGLLEGTFYFWTHDDPIGSGNNAGPDAYNFSNDDYSVVTVDASGVFSATASSNQVGSGAITASKFVASGQGFFANVTGNGTIQFNNDMRVTNENNHFLRPANNNIDRLWLNLRNQNHSIFRQILVGFHNGATDAFVNGQDGQRMSNGNNTDFYSLIPNNTRRFAIQNLNTFNDTKTVNLGLEIIEDGIYEIAIDHSEGVFANGQAVYIKDNLDNSYHEITNGIYQFNATIGDDINNRFELVFRNSALGIDDHSVATDLIITQKGDFFNLNTTDGNEIKAASLYNMLGQELGNYQSANGSLQIPSNKYSVGSVLIIKTTLDNGNVISKKVIKL